MFKKPNFASDEAGEIAAQHKGIDFSKYKGEGQKGALTVDDVKSIVKDNTVEGTGSLEATDKASADIQKTDNRVTLDSIKEKIQTTEFIYPETAPHMTIAVITMENGFFVTGQSAPADPENFNEELGKQLAYEDAMRKIWPLEGYLLREQLS